jgi:hypothetical protein
VVATKLQQKTPVQNSDLVSVMEGDREFSFKQEERKHAFKHSVDLDGEATVLASLFLSLTIF